MVGMKYAPRATKEMVTVSTNITYMRADGVEVEAGDWIAAGYGADADFGRVQCVDSDGVAMVAWDSGVVTPCDVDHADVYTTRAGAEGGAADRASGHDNGDRGHHPDKAVAS